jgi:hypothetical protein
VSHGAQATQVLVAASHEVPGEQVAAAQLSPAFAKAVHFMPSKQDPVRQVTKSGTPGYCAHAMPIRPAAAQRPPASQAAQATQPVGASVQFSPSARRGVQVPCRQNWPPGQSPSAWHPLAPRTWQVPVLV